MIHCGGVGHTALPVALAHRAGGNPLRSVGRPRAVDVGGTGAVHRAGVDFFLPYDKKNIELPTHFVPDESFLRYHNEKVFIK